MKRFDKLMLTASGISFILAVYLWFSGNKQAGSFVGTWVPSIITLGVYLKSIRLVDKVEKALR